MQAFDVNGTGARVSDGGRMANRGTWRLSMNHRKLVVSLVAVGAMALVAWPVYAHCGKCAGSAKEMVTAMDAGKVTLGAAITAAETAAKGKAVAANCDMEGGKLDFDVYVLVGDKIMQVEVDATGKAGKSTEVKEFPVGADDAPAKKPVKGG